MDEHMGRRTVGGLLFTKGGSILLFREDSSRRKPGACCSRHGCNGTRHSADKSRPMHSHRDTAASAATKEAAPTPQKSQRKPPQGSSNAAGSCSETDNGTPLEAATAPGAGRDLLARLKDRVNASRKRSLAREMSSPSSSSSSGFSAGSSSGGAARSSSAVSMPTRRAVSRIRKTDEGENAGGGRRAPRRDTGGGGDARGNSGDMVTAEQRAAREQPPAEGFISGFLARYRSGLHGGSLPSLQDGAEDSGYWRFDVEGSEELENYFMLSDRHRAMRMDIDDMSYEELLALGDRIGTVNTGLSEDALYKCLKRSLYTHTAPETHQDCDRKCSICQEEYSGGEEVGKMACKHYYHITCIQHWLRQKNWCPICKSVAAKIN